MTVQGLQIPSGLGGRRETQDRPTEGAVTVPFAWATTEDRRQPRKEDRRSRVRESYPREGKPPGCQQWGARDQSYAGVLESIRAWGRQRGLPEHLQERTYEPINYLMWGTLQKMVRRGRPWNNKRGRHINICKDSEKSLKNWKPLPLRKRWGKTRNSRRRNIWILS